MDEHECWSNRETWSANLHIMNDYPSYQVVTELVRDIVATARDRASDAGPFDTRMCEAELAENLEYHFGQVPRMCDGLARDLLESAFAAVDWHEIAHEIVAEEILRLRRKGALNV